MRKNAKTIIGVLVLGLLLGGCTRNAHQPTGDGPKAKTTNAGANHSVSQSDGPMKTGSGQAGWSTIRSVTNVSLPRGALAAAFVVW